MQSLEQVLNAELLSNLTGAKTSELSGDQLEEFSPIRKVGATRLEFPITQRTEVIAPTRTLKIEAAGDPFKGLVKPKIRLIGRWLERAGFKPGHHVQLTLVAPGVMELRSGPGLSGT